MGRLVSGQAAILPSPVFCWSAPPLPPGSAQTHRLGTLRLITPGVWADLSLPPPSPMPNPPPSSLGTTRRIPWASGHFGVLGKLVGGIRSPVSSKLKLPSLPDLTMAPLPPQGVSGGDLSPRLEVTQGYVHSCPPAACLWSPRVRVRGRAPGGAAAPGPPRRGGGGRPWPCPVPHSRGSPLLLCCLLPLCARVPGTRPWVSRRLWGLRAGGSGPAARPTEL